MPLAGYIGKDPVANFSYCVGNIQKDMMGFFLEPIQYVLAMVMGIIYYQRREQEKKITEQIEKAKIENIDFFYSYFITFAFVAIVVGSAIFVNN